LAGGVIQGLNDAGIETFEGDYAHYVVRESAQNSLDAAASHDHPVRIEIAVHSLSVQELPFFPDLRETVRACKTFWHGQPRPVEFFDRAILMARHQSIYALRVSDFGTTGVPGGDKDMNEPWFGLVRSRGVSIKTDEASAGAFGIGKDAPLAASAFRTVVYSTRTLDGDIAVQGICRLASHKNGNGLTQGSGFIGDFDKARGEHLALRNPDSIPERFLRTDPGLDVWIIGFRYEDEWESPFIAAALNNFWPAIHFGKLELRIADINITSDRLPSLMENYSHHASVAAALPYYQALVNADSRRGETELPIAGHCRLFVHLGKGDLPRRVCMTRKTGMVIYHYAPRVVRVPFAALFQCDDQRGNQLLKALEPPRHDHWDPKRATNRKEKQAIEEIKTWIKDSLKALVPDLDSEVINEDSIADLLPDEDLPGADDSESGEGDIGGIPSQAQSLSRPIATPPATRIAGKGKSARGTGGKGGGGTGTTDPKKGDLKNTGGRRKRRGGEEDGGGGAARSNTRIDLRCYREGDRSGVYQLIARASEDYSGDIFIDAVTEDGGSVPCQLKEGYDDQGKAVAIIGNKISGVEFKEGQSVRLKVELLNPARLALRASTT